MISNPVKHRVLIIWLKTFDFLLNKNFKKRKSTFLKELSIVANFDWRHRRQKQGKAVKSFLKIFQVFLIALVKDGSLALVSLVARWSGFHVKGPGSIPGWLIYFWLEYFQKLFKKLCKADITLLDAKNLHHISTYIS